MRKILTILFLSIALFSYSQDLRQFQAVGINTIDSSFWSTGNGNLYPANTSLNVGIGTTYPIRNLNVDGNVFFEKWYGGTPLRFILDNDSLGSQDGTPNVSIIAGNPDSLHAVVQVLGNKLAIIGSQDDISGSNIKYNMKFDPFGGRITIESHDGGGISNKSYIYPSYWNMDADIIPTVPSVYSLGSLSNHWLTGYIDSIYSIHFNYSDGTQADGYVFTSDGSGNGTWKAPYLLGQDSLNFGTIAPNGHQVLTITVTGAELSDVVTLGIPNASMSDHASYVAWVSATDSVSVKCFNFDGSSFDPSIGLFKVKVIK